MKKSSHSRITRFLLAAFLLAPLAAHGEADPNHLLSFKKIYVDPVQDNVDGTFKAPVEQSYKEIFDRNPRFELVSDRGSADSEIKTTLEKKTSGLDIEISLIVTDTNEIFSTDKSTIPATASGAETGKAVKALLK